MTTDKARQTLGSQQRIRRSAEITRIFQHGRVLAGHTLRLYVLPNGLPMSRVAAAVSFRHGGAVRRNRLKRLCREAFRTSRQDLPVGYDFVLQPRAGAELTFQSIRDSLLSLTRSLPKGPPS